MVVTDSPYVPFDDRSLNVLREFLHRLFALPPPDAAPNDAGAAVPSASPSSAADSLVVPATEAYAGCLRPFHQWSLRGAAMVRSLLLVLLLIR